MWKRPQLTAFEAPSFYVLGAAKSGTTAVWSWLRTHPQVFLPEVKEPGYFAFAGGRAEPDVGHFDPDYTSTITTTPGAYQSLYEGSAGLVSGDVSPVYLASPHAAERIHAARPDARLVIILRDPVKRAFSQYCHHRRDGLDPITSFDDALAAEPDRAEAGWSWAHRYAELGDYASQIQRYTDRFPKAQILFLEFDQLRADPQSCWYALCRHIGVSVIPMPKNERVNMTAGLSGVPSRPAVTRLLTHPGLIQKVLKSAVPKPARTAIRRVIEGRPAEMPVLGDSVRRALSQRYVGQFPQIEALTGLDCAHWERP